MARPHSECVGFDAVHPCLDWGGASRRHGVSLSVSCSHGSEELPQVPCRSTPSVHGSSSSARSLFACRCVCSVFFLSESH